MKYTSVAAILCYFCTSASADDGGPLKCDFSRVDSPKVSMRIENGDITGAELTVPRDYIMSGEIRSGTTRETLLIRVWKDSFLPFTRADAHSELQTQRFAAGIKDDLVILIGSLKYFDAIARMAVSGGNYPLPFNSPDADLHGVLLPNGLYGQKIKPIPHFSNVFLGRDGERITDIISCKQIGDVPFPGCDHIFESGPYDLQISYRLDELDHWKELRNQTAALIDCFTTKMPTQKPRN